jgi:hypothetical protein
MSEPTASNGAMAALMAKRTVKASSGEAPKRIRRRTANVPIDHNLCEPDTFDADFVIGIESLPPDKELAALKISGGDGMAVGLALARQSLQSVDDVPLKAVEKDVLWESLGFAGRMVVVNAYLQHCTGTGNGSALGKAMGIEIG